MADKNRGGFSFKDRSGRVHSIGNRKGGAEAHAKGESSGGRSEKGSEKRPDKSARSERSEGRKSDQKFGKRFDRKAKGTVGSRRIDRTERPARGERPERPTPTDRTGAIQPFGRAVAGERGPKRFGRGERTEREDRPRRGEGHKPWGMEGRSKDSGHGGGAGYKKKRFDRDTHREKSHDSAPWRDKRGQRRRDRHQPSDIVAQTLKGTIDKNRKGFAFLCFDSAEFEDAFIAPRDADRFFHGDRVEVRIGESGEVIDITVLEHRFRALVGRYLPMPSGRGKGGYVVYERKRAQERLFCPEGAANASQGDWVLAEVEFGDSGPLGKVVEVYGRELPARADIGMVAGEYNLIEMHSDEADKEARSYSLDLDDPNRRDFRNIPFITIDGETARDFDDAVYVERDRSGYVLWVAIADVSHYVKPGTALDEEARSRGTSVYFPERAFHMLPRALSENLCSLRPKEPRLTMVARMEIDRTGKKTKTEVFEGLIESRRRATYTEIAAEAQEHGADPKWEFAPHLELYRILRKARNERGSIDFDLPEAEMKVTPEGEVESIKIRERNDAHRLIEEFMIGANEAVTEWMLEKAWPFVYRVHEEPAEKSLQRFVELAETVGVKVKLNSDERLHQQLNSVIKKVDGHPAQFLLNTALLRSMKQATYTSVHGGHFGLASEGYTHFTSPIRRYPDLVVHRLLRWALQVERKDKAPLSATERQDLEKELEDICGHCSYRERLASDAERESIKLKQVRIMTRHLGDEFEGTIIGMVESGFFVQIRDPYVEGMVNRDSLQDDFYEFNEDRMIFYGKRKRRTFKIGDKVRVQAVAADLETRTIDFQLVSEKR